MSHWGQSGDRGFAPKDKGKLEKFEAEEYLCLERSLQRTHDSGKLEDQITLRCPDRLDEMNKTYLSAHPSSQKKKGVGVVEKKMEGSETSLSQEAATNGDWEGGRL